MATLILVLIDGTTQTLTARSVIRGTDRSGGLCLLVASVAATSCRHPAFVVAGLSDPFFGFGGTATPACSERRAGAQYAGFAWGGDFSSFSLFSTHCPLPAPMKRVSLSRTKQIT